MVNGIIASDPRGLNKWRGSKFCVGSRVRQETPEEGQRTYRPKRCEYNNEDNSPKTLNDKNKQMAMNRDLERIYDKQNDWYIGIRYEVVSLVIGVQIVINR